MAPFSSISSSRSTRILGPSDFDNPMVRRGMFHIGYHDDLFDLAKDYYITHYSAEIVNTLTNLMFTYCAYKGIKSCQRQGHDTVFIVAYYGYLLVSVGSFMFHTTLKYPWQLVDELNMIYTTCLMVYVSLSYSRSTNTQVALGAFLVVFCIFITLYYHYLQDPVFHQTVYGILTTFIVFWSAYSMEVNLRPSLRHTEEKDRQYRQKKNLNVKSQAQQSYENQRDLKILKNMWIFVAYGLTVFLTGFLMWGLDIKYCSSLRRWRRSVGMPWGFFLEFHGWWHLLTGYGAYCYIVWGIHLRHILNGDHDRFVMVWPNFWTMPEIVQIPEANGMHINGTANGTVNGHAKKTK